MRKDLASTRGYVPGESALVADAQAEAEARQEIDRARGKSVGDLMNAIADRMAANPDGSADLCRARRLIERAAGDPSPAVQAKAQEILSR